MVKIAKNSQNGLRLFKMIQNGPWWWKMVKMVQNGPKLWEMVKIGLKWSRIVKMVKNGGPDLRQARRIDLSARRARMTKSRGPKGLQLEVGARRAPRLLVLNISLILFIGHIYLLLKIAFLSFWKWRGLHIDKTWHAEKIVNVKGPSL